MTTPIGKIVGIFKTGIAGVGQHFTILDRIDSYTWKFANGCRIIYGIKFADLPKDVLEKNSDAVIIDCVYDGVTVKDPHRSNPMIFVTNYPGNMGGRTWFGYFVPPSYTKYLAPGKHTVQIKIAPRKLLQALRGRDFSVENGGVISEVFTFEVTGDGTNSLNNPDAPGNRH